MATFARSIEVGVPRETAFRQWTRFKDFPLFLYGLRDVRDLGDGALLWRCDDRDRLVRVTHKLPHQAVAWQEDGEDGPATLVSLDAITTDRTRILLARNDPMAAFSDRSRISSELDADLERFKSLVEGAVRTRGDGPFLPTLLADGG